MHTSRRQREHNGNCLTVGCLWFMGFCLVLGTLAAIGGKIAGVV